MTWNSTLNSIVLSIDPRFGLRMISTGMSRIVSEGLWGAELLKWLKTGWLYHFFFKDTQGGGFSPPPSAHTI